MIRSILIVLLSFSYIGAKAQSPNMLLLLFDDHSYPLLREADIRHPSDGLCEQRLAILYK